MKKASLVYFILYLYWNALFCTQGAFGQPIAESPFKIPFKKSAAISDEAGKPKSSTTWYFPAEYFIDSSEVRMRVPKDQVTESMRNDSRYEFLPGNLVLERKVKTRIDTFKLNWFSYDLYKLQEPILSNFPLEKEVYRLTWLRSFQPPVVISMEKKGAVIQLFTKMLRTIPELPGHRYTSWNGTMHMADTLARMPFKENRSKRISVASYQTFTQLIDKLQALHSSPLGSRNSIGSDGSEWILETHRPDGYYFLIRWSPAGDQPIRILGDYLLNLSDAKKEIRY